MMSSLLTLYQQYQGQNNLGVGNDFFNNNPTGFNFNQPFDHSVPLPPAVEEAAAAGIPPNVYLGPPRPHNPNAVRPADVFGDNPLPWFFPNMAQNAQVQNVQAQDDQVEDPSVAQGDDPNTMFVGSVTLPAPHELGRVRIVIRGVLQYGSLPQTAMDELRYLFPDHEDDLADHEKDNLKTQRQQWLLVNTPGTDGSRRRAHLFVGRAFGFTYLEIKNAAQLPQPEASLRGLWRVMTTDPAHRLRSPLWNELDVSLTFDHRRRLHTHTHSFFSPGRRASQLLERQRPWQS
ncbi:hypothetical protein B0T10DRAFT_102632 [Thelonectria olida]|uniref:Uncharacterized protein n=1 Tax=Thelonectria olida TaxID=1576542 RepID=A0A9P8WHU1_9HYPO|nr:hypothetical protein B0T10DRAFT_102632 [Thelonectria olida]